MPPDDRPPLTLLVNPASAGGRGLRALPDIESALDARRVEFRVERTRSLEHAAAAANVAADAGEVPVAVGGDGLVGAVGGAMAGVKAPLGIVPTGRGNDLARVLGIPSDPIEAIGVALDGEERRIDVGTVNGARFLGIASLGFDSIANAIANEARLLRGNAVYTYAALRALATWKPARFTVRTASERLRLSGCNVVVANSSSYGGGMLVAPDADLGDGLFDVVSVGEASKLRLLRIFREVFKGTHTSADEVSVFRAARLEVSASRPFAVYGDGERLADLPATFRIMPRALAVKVPRAPA